MFKKEILAKTKFGEIIAEDERENLRAYFVETEFWRRVYGDAVDIIYGEKGAGKGAIYVLIDSLEDELFDKKVLLVSAESVRGSAVFRTLITDPPASEREFVYLWKLYIAALIGRTLREYDLSNSSSIPAIEALEEAGLLPKKDSTLASILRSVMEYARRLRPSGIEGGVNLDPISGLPIGMTGKILFDEPRQKDREQGGISTDEVIARLNANLDAVEYDIWILMDRLDVAFEENEELEENALRALFRVYLDIAANRRIGLKIFLRSDIWNRITKKGFREATHLTRGETISWNDKALFNLVIRRLLANKAIVSAFDIRKDTVLQSEEQQRELFRRLFPEKVDQAEKKPLTFDWMLSRVEDGAGRRSPRDIVLFLNELVKQELSRLEHGGKACEGEILFDRSSFKAALPVVSQYKLERSLYAENPRLRSWIEKLRGGKSELSLDNLKGLWNVEQAESIKLADELVEIGFFKKKTTEEFGTTYWIPFVFRPALELTMGRAAQSEDD